MAPENPSHHNGSSRGNRTEPILPTFPNYYGIWSSNQGDSSSSNKNLEEDRTETKSTPPKQIIHGFENEIKSLQNFLLDKKVYKEFKSLVVAGEYGVGKTALCQKIFNDETVKSVYVPRIWVSMYGEEREVGEDGKISVLKRILKSLGFEDQKLRSIHVEAVEEAANNQESTRNDRETDQEKEISALLYALHLNLKYKKYLIVFDDVREEDNWDQILGLDDDKKVKKWGNYLSDGFPKGSGGRVIYTSRDEDLADKLVAEKHEVHRLWPLSDPGSVWKIYKDALVDNKKEVPRNDKKCIEELMNKSRGLPLAARLMGMLPPVFLDDEPATINNSSNGPTAPTAPIAPTAPAIPSNG